MTIQLNGSDISPATPLPVPRPASGRLCLECDQPVIGKKRRSQFCSGRCRTLWNNRRITRGAELYDLVMEWRFDRATADDRRTLSMICASAARFHEEDKQHRGGRRSWSPSRRMLNIGSRLGR